jgi:hypothetical protein
MVTEAEGCVRDSNAALTRVAVLKAAPRFVFKKRSSILHNALPVALYGSSRERARRSTVRTNKCFANTCHIYIYIYTHTSI